MPPECFSEGFGGAEIMKIIFKRFGFRLSESSLFVKLSRKGGAGKRNFM